VHERRAKSAACPHTRPEKVKKRRTIHDRERPIKRESEKAPVNEEKNSEDGRPARTEPKEDPESSGAEKKSAGRRQEP